MQGMNQIQVIDNALDDDTYKQLEQAICSDQFPWFFGPSLKLHNEHDQLIDNTNRDPSDIYSHFSYELFTIQDGIKNHFTRELLFPAIKSLDIQIPFRVKANCNILMPNPHSVKKSTYLRQEGLTYHIDNPFKDAKTSILYFDDCDGYTIFKDSQEKVTSKRNRLVTFPSSTYHTGVPQTDTQRRILININYF